MTENEQIEEMAKYIDHAEEYECCEPMVSCKDCRYHKYSDMCYCTSVKEAEYLYSKGYRKVERGENITKNHPVDEFVCSKCGIHLEEWVRVVIDEDRDETYYYEYAFKFCPHCGADMRGEKDKRSIKRG